METKRCSRCQQHLPLELFGSHISKQYKTQGKLIYSGICKPCAREYAKEWRKKNPGYKKPNDKRDPVILSIIRARRQDAKARCKGDVASVDYLYDLLMQQGQRCALSGLPLTYNKGDMDVLSLDQIDPGKGYGEGNVQWVSWRVNRAKGDQTLAEFKRMCEAVLKV